MMLGKLLIGGRQLGQQLWAYSPTLALLLGFAGLAGMAWVGGVVLNRLSTYYFARSYTEQLVQSRGLDPHLGDAIVWASFFFLSYCMILVFSLSPWKRRLGLSGVFSFLIGHSLLLTGREPFVGGSGQAARCYIITRDTISYGSVPGTDPKTGLDCTPVTPEIVEKIRIYQAGGRPQRQADGCAPFFEPRTGNPVCWYSRRDGTIELFNLMGFHPESGEELKPVTREIVAAWQNQPSKVPKLIEASTSTTYFHPVTGAPLVWFRRTESGEYEFYDARGFHPITGEALEPVTRENVAQIRKVVAEAEARKAQAAARKCYSLTSDSVRYGTTVGPDPATGKLCRPLSDSLLERLKEYEKGRRPAAITDPAPVMFDPRSGEPLVWYWKSPGGQIELYDLMGFHGRTGDELLPITKEMAHEYSQQIRPPAEPPKPIRLTSGTQCFDPITRAPKCWHTRHPDGTFEFFDAPGFHPTFGYPLQEVTLEVITKMIDDQQAMKVEAEAKARREKDARDKQEAARLVARQQASLAIKRCDDLAANPTDRERVGVGVPHQELKLYAKEAQQACKEAMEQDPSNRLRYQYARALAFEDKAGAMRIFQSLSAAKYAAAFDNLGWILIDTDKQGAVAAFRSGVALGDPDSMVSLVETYQRRFATPRNEAETEAALLQRACQLGHQQGCTALQALQEQPQTGRTQGGKMSPEDLERLFSTFMNIIPKKNR